MAVEPDVFLKIYPEFVLPPEQAEAWRNDRQGAIVGRDVANRFGWKIGDKIPLTATIWQPKGGGTTWEFNIVGIYDGGDAVDKTQMFFRYDYLDENRAQGEGQVGWYVVKISDPAHAVDLSHTFDEMFANSSAETKTTTEKGFVEGFAKQIGDIGSIMIAISSTVLFMFGLVAASTMAQSVRERTSELAVLKTLGFSGAAILTPRSCRIALHCLHRRAARPRRGVADRPARRSDRRHAPDFRAAPERSRGRDWTDGDDGCAGRSDAGRRGDAAENHRCVEAHVKSRERRGAMGPRQRAARSGARGPRDNG